MLAEIRLHTVICLVLALVLGACAQLPSPLRKAGAVAAQVGTAGLDLGKAAVYQAQSTLGRVDGRGHKSQAQPFNAEMALNQSSQSNQRGGGTPSTPSTPLAGQAMALPEQPVIGGTGSAFKPSNSAQGLGGLRSGNGMQAQSPGFGSSETSRGAAVQQNLAGQCPRGYLTISDAKQCSAASMCLRLPGGMTCLPQGG